MLHLFRLSQCPHEVGQIMDQGMMLEPDGVRLAGITHWPDGRDRAFRDMARRRLDPTTLCHRILSRLPAGPLVPAETRRLDQTQEDDIN